MDGSKAKPTSWLDNEEEAAWRDELIEMLQAQQAELWSRIDDEKFVAVMDKKPEIHYGPTFVENKIPTPPFLVEPFFPSGGLCLLHGKRGLGKSMLAMTLTRCIAKGEPFLDQFPCRKGTVVYIQLDMTDTVFQSRLRDAGDYYKFDDWYVLTGVASIGRATQNTPWVQDIVAKLPDLIVIDTLRKAHSWPENDSDSAGRFYSKLRELFGYTAVMMLHHDRKSQEGNVGFSEEAFRGSGAWLDDIDAGLHFKKVGNGLQLEFSKTRTCPDIEPVPIAIDDRTLSIMADPMRQAKTTLARQRVSKFLSQNPEADKEDAYEHLLSFGDLSKSQASKAVREMMVG